MRLVYAPAFPDLVALSRIELERSAYETNLVPHLEPWGERRVTIPLPPGPHPGALPIELRSPCFTASLQRESDSPRLPCKG